ncbi:DNA replication factor C, large subunit [Cutaneotrichosporon oleaginosum]|uniref:Replication factor C subunit 1 n=1 Tax=Cutaneotrichosporon oleaginosum TaxID=879819 RepID=A0A0J0XE16_9TREE|nr:DNA replication factor C, large subunit [Cutaneotrichosporon oleaginosum]KLT39341.1 DNA replication factor C, large subunit [Cutaneotrichosporon oleaginosum]
MPSSPSTRKSQGSQKESQEDKPKKAAAPRKPAAVAGADLRGWFKPGASSGSAPSKAKEEVKPTPKAKGTGDEPIMIDESDDDVPVKKPASRAPPKSALPKAGTTSKHFSAASSSKRAVRVESSPEPEPSPKKVPSKTSTPRAAKSAAKRTTYVESSDEEEAKPKRRTPAKRAPLESEEEAPPPKKMRGKKAPSSDEEMSEDDVKPKRAAAKKSPSEKPAAKAPPTKKPPAKAPPAKAPASKDKKPAVHNDDDEEKKPAKPNFYAMAARRAAGPAAPGSKEIPDGDPTALAGLSFVFTGELQSLGRDDAIELCKRYHGRVVGTPSGKTDYVVVGENAGASKIAKIKEKKLKTLTEDEFLDLIRTRKGELDEAQQKALEKKEKEVIKAAEEMARREEEEEKLRKRKEKALAGTGVAAKKTAPASAQLWTTKYAPKTIKEICGNKSNIEKLQTWLANWQKNYNSSFKKPGKDGSGLFRAVLISGPPGIGKTTSAHIIAQESGYSPLELNASDTRSKKLLENGTNIDNTSLDGFFQGKGVKSTTVTDLNLSKRTCLIMDEVDGMSAGDRGGVGALNALIKKTKIPLILICNDRNLPKMKPLWGSTFSLAYRRPGPQEIRSRILSILFKEKLKIPANVVDEIVKGTNSDIRQVLNMLSTYKLGKSEMDFDEGKQLIKMNEKNTIMTPFTITDKLCGPYSFSRTSKETLNDKMDLYFQDFSFIPLFIQEHYLKTNPARINHLDGHEKDLKNLELISKAADAISDGDLVDRLIHGGEQHWSLLPLHAVNSTVRPAYHIFGTNRSTNGGGWGGPSFPQWLGQNSKMGKLQRELTDIQIRMRLRVSGSRDEIRQQYMPLLAGKIVKPLMDDGSEAIDGTIETMDEYFLGKEDWDAFVELGVGDMADDKILKKIPSATKAAFTRTYNKRDHPIAFHKGDMFAASRKKIAAEKEQPDNEDVFEDDAPPPDDDDDKGDDEVNDVSKDKLIKAVGQGKGKGKAKAPAGKKGAKK